MAVAQPSSDAVKAFLKQTASRTESLYAIYSNYGMLFDASKYIRQWMNQPETVKFLAYCEAIWHSDKFYWPMYDRAFMEIRENNDSQYPSGWHQKGGECIAWDDAENCAMAMPFVAEHFERYLQNMQDGCTELLSIPEARERYLKSLKEYALSIGKDEDEASRIANDENNRLRSFEHRLR